MHTLKSIILAALLLSGFSSRGSIVPGRPDVLIWDASTSPNVTYVVFRGATNGTWTSQVNVGTVTNVTLTNIAYGVWWFMVESFSNGVFSIPSNAIDWTNAPDPPFGLRIRSATNASIDLWIALPDGSVLVESSTETIGLWEPFVEVKSLAFQAPYQVGIRVYADDPRRFYRAQ